MSKSPVKLVAVSPCANLDHFINTFISRNRKDSPSNQLFQTKQKRKKQFSRNGFSHKTSLADWRSLYSHERPKTQSLILNINKPKIMDFHDLQEYSPTTKKNKFNRTSVRHWPIPQDEAKLESKTSFNFYRSPIFQNQIQIIGNLTARMDGSSRDFKKRKFRNNSSFPRRENKDKMLKDIIAF